MGAFEPRAYGAPKSTKGPCTNARVASLCVLALYVQQEHATHFQDNIFIGTVTSFVTNACQPQSFVKTQTF